MATKKTETLKNDEEIEKEENIVAKEIRTSKTRSKSEAKTTRKTTNKNTTVKKNIEKTGASKKKENNNDKKIKTSPKNEIKNGEKVETKQVAAKKNTKKESTENQKNEEKNKKVTKKQENKSSENKIKEKAKAIKKSVSKDNKKVITREEKLKEIVEKVNQLENNEKNESNENNEIEENTEIVPEEKVVKIEEIKKTIKNKKTIPKEETDKINKMLFKNIIIAICIITYFIFLNLGKMNIKNDVYVTDLKVFSICTLLTAIALIEVAYKKDSGEIALYGIEMIVLSITTLALIYVNLMLSTRYVFIVAAISFIFAIYYLIKSIVMYLKKKKQYFVNDIKEIMNKDE